MTNNKLDKFKKLVSKEKSGWLEKAKWRKENQEWLDISFAIAVKVLSALSKNRATGTYPSTQKELAEAMDCSPQYISKLLKGQERLGIDTITRVGKTLGIKLIAVPEEDIIKEEIISEERSFTMAVQETKLIGSISHFNKLIPKDNKRFLDYNKMLEKSTYVSGKENHLKVVA